MNTPDWIKEKVSGWSILTMKAFVQDPQLIGDYYPKLTSTECLQIYELAARMLEEWRKITGDNV